MVFGWERKSIAGYVVLDNNNQKKQKRNFFVKKGGQVEKLLELNLDPLDP